MKKLFVDDFYRLGKHGKKYSSLEMLFEHPRGHWFTGKRREYDGGLEKTLRRFMRRAPQDVPIFVLYNIPNRDGNSFSKGGAIDSETYLEWIQSFANGIGNSECIVILEPDALPRSILSWENIYTGNLIEQVDLLSKALCILKNTKAKVYLDVGHPRWLSAEIASSILKEFDALLYEGFSVNVSNFVDDECCIQWGTEVSRIVNGKHFIIDTSRNGSNVTGWCNPLGATIGRFPTLETGNNLVDAFLWIKVPGESDGYCNFGPKAGMFWPEYALDLIRKIK